MAVRNSPPSLMAVLDFGSSIRGSIKEILFHESPSPPRIDVCPEFPSHYFFVGLHKWMGILDLMDVLDLS